MDLVESSIQCWGMNYFENFHIHLYKRNGKLIDEQTIGDHNPLLEITTASGSKHASNKYQPSVACGSGFSTVSLHRLVTTSASYLYKYVLLQRNVSHWIYLFSSLKKVQTLFIRLAKILYFIIHETSSFDVIQTIKDFSYKDCIFWIDLLNARITKARNIHYYKIYAYF